MTININKNKTQILNNVWLDEDGDIDYDTYLNKFHLNFTINNYKTFDIEMIQNDIMIKLNDETIKLNNPSDLKWSINQHHLINKLNQYFEYNHDLKFNSKFHYLPEAYNDVLEVNELMNDSINKHYIGFTFDIVL